MNDKYELTDKTRQFNWVKLYQIKAKRNFSYVCKWELGGWIETEDNLSKSGDSWVYDNARVSDNAWVCGKYNYTKWKFIWWDDMDKITREQAQLIIEGGENGFKGSF